MKRKKKQAKNKTKKEKKNNFRGIKTLAFGRGKGGGGKRIIEKQHE